jgi:hypothetical protein
MTNVMIDALDTEKLVTEALERVKDDLAALRPEELVQVNLDIKQAVSTIIGALPEIRALRDRFVTELPTFNMEAFDKLEDYAWALSYAQALHLTATGPSDDLESLNEDAIRLRDRLLADATSLSKHGLLDGAPLAELKGVNGYKNLAQDLQVLATMMQAAWPTIQGKCPTRAEDLPLALRTSARLFRVVGLREQGPAQIEAAADRRQRAFTLTLRVYEDVRRAVGYLRARQGDAETIAPTLFPGKAKFGKKEKPEEKPADGQPPAGTPPTAPPAVVAPAAPASQPVVPGLSGNNGPFMS